MIQTFGGSVNGGALAVALDVRSSRLVLRVHERLGSRSTVEECRARAAEAIEVHMAGLVADGEPVPEEAGTPRLLSVTVAA